MDKILFESLYIFLASLGLLLITGLSAILCSFVNKDTQIVWQKDIDKLLDYSRGDGVAKVSFEYLFCENTFN